MRNTEGALQPAARAGGGTVKPLPPDDLWAKIDAIQIEVSKSKPIERPPNSFTCTEFRERNPQLTDYQAHEQIRKMINAGKVRKVRVGYSMFYTLCE